MKRILLLLSAAILAMGFTGCSETQQTSDSADGKLKIYTSIYPLYDFTQKVAGDKAEVVNLVPAGVEPHDWEPSTTDIKNLENADMLVYNGAGMEHWVDKVVSSLENKALVAVEASKRVELLIGEGSGHEEDEKSEDEHDDENGAQTDPHVWMSLRNAIIEMTDIKDALCAADSANASVYQANYEAAVKEFDALDQKFSETLSALPNKNIVVAHAAFSYLCQDYGLNQVAIEGLSADSEPDPARMTEIIRFAKENNIKVIFFEELVSPKVAETIANEIGAATDMLNPLEGLTEEQLAAGEDYLSIMEQNLAAIKRALSE